MGLNSPRDPVGSCTGFVQAVDQAADHLGDAFEALSESEGRRFLHKPAPAGDLQQRHAFLRRSSGDGEEVSAVGLCETTIPLGQVGGDREGGAIQLVNEEAITAGKAPQ